MKSRLPATLTSVLFASVRSLLGRMLLVAAIVPLTLASPCEVWCEVPCAQLNGDIEQECKGCGVHMLCNPEAADYPEVFRPPASPLPAAEQTPSTTKGTEVVGHQRLRLSDFEAEELESGQRVSFSKFAGQVLLIVNLASQCGFTEETYAQLNELHARYATRGLVVLGFPSNDFEQEPADVPGLVDFIFREKKVRWSTFRKVAVQGEAAHPLFAALTANSGRSISWNFESFLVDRNAVLRSRWPAGTDLTWKGSAVSLIEAVLAEEVVQATEAATEELTEPATTNLEAAAAKWDLGEEQYMQDHTHDEVGNIPDETPEEVDAVAQRVWEQIRSEPGTTPPSLCERLDASVVRNMSVDERARQFSRPTLITGLMTHWPAMHAWGSSRKFARRFGHHLVNHKRLEDSTRKERVVAGVESDPTLRRMVASRNHSTLVIYAGEYRRSLSEEELLDDLRRDGMWATPDVLMRTFATHVVSFGGGPGVLTANHGFAWLGLLTGVKVWYLASPSNPRPAHPLCDKRRVHAVAGTTRCVQKRGDVVVVPTAWVSHSNRTLIEHHGCVGGTL